MAIVHLKKRKDSRIEKGHPWVYQSEISSIEGESKPGDIVDVINHSGSYMGKGYLNPQSQITVRLLSRTSQDINDDFFRDRIKQARTLRQKVISPDTDSFRLIHAESDRLPALVVDQYGDYLVVQFLSLGMDVRKEQIVRCLQDVCNPLGIYERSDVNVRRLEGLPLTKGFLQGKFDTRLPIIENGFHFIADIENGQKTGYFFDQRENRKALQRYVKNQRVLDCFSYVGSFSVHAAGYGAAETVSVEISAEAVADIQANMDRNHIETPKSIICGNVFDELRVMETNQDRFGVIVLDPPAFTKSKGSVPGALRGYKEINLRAMKLLDDGGYLITSSCSHHISEEIFWQMLQEAASDAHKSVQIIERRMQGSDHPVLLASKETQYLKFLILRVSD